ncbi:MAG: DUF2795 domain-containing protein [Acidimicrobiales bacterium]
MDRRDEHRPDDEGLHLPGTPIDDAFARTQVARLLPPAAFPTTAAVLADGLEEAGAEEAVVAAVRALPRGRLYESPGEVWAAAHALGA